MGEPQPSKELLDFPSKHKSPSSIDSCFSRAKSCGSIRRAIATLGLPPNHSPRAKQHAKEHNDTELMERTMQVLRRNSLPLQPGTADIVFNICYNAERRALLSKYAARFVRSRSSCIVLHLTFSWNLLSKLVLAAACFRLMPSSPTQFLVQRSYTGKASAMMLIDGIYSRNMLQDFFKSGVKLYRAAFDIFMEFAVKAGTGSCLLPSNAITTHPILSATELQRKRFIRKLNVGEAGGQLNNSPLLCNHCPKIGLPCFC